jgi:hypothetical protein
VSAYNDGVNPSAHLQSVICQLDFLPKFSLANEISGLAPLLAKGLHSEDDDGLVVATLTSLRDILNQVFNCSIATSANKHELLLESNT